MSFVSVYAAWRFSYTQSKLCAPIYGVKLKSCTQSREKLIHRATCHASTRTTAVTGCTEFSGLSVCPSFFCKSGMSTPLEKLFETGTKLAFAGQRSRSQSPQWPSGKGTGLLSQRSWNRVPLGVILSNYLRGLRRQTQAFIPSQAMTLLQSLFVQKLSGNLLKDKFVLSRFNY